MAGLLAPREAPDLPGMRSGVLRGGRRLQEGRGGPWGGALTEVWRYFPPVGADSRRVGVVESQCRSVAVSQCRSAAVP